MGSSFDFIPVIDVSPLMDKADDPKGAEDGGVLEVVRRIDEACKEAGFFYVKGHGVPDSLIKEVKVATLQFFNLSYKEKIRIKLSPASGYRGYQRIGENVTMGTPNMQEAVDFYREMEPGEYGALGTTLEGSNLWPDDNFKILMEEYISRLKDIARKIMRGIALALGGPLDAFEGKMAGDSFWVARLIGYPTLSDLKNSETQNTDIGCGAHTDYGLLSLINQDDDINALQVRNRSGEWICAVPIPGTFVCNIGEMLKVWSNGVYEPTLHKVINTPKYRISVAFFYEPNFDSSVEPFDFCKKKTGGVAKFERVVYGEYLVRKVTNNFVK